jgi:hypothetical protein
MSSLIYMLLNIHFLSNVKLLTYTWHTIISLRNMSSSDHLNSLTYMLLNIHQMWTSHLHLTHDKLSMKYDFIRSFKIVPSQTKVFSHTYTCTAIVVDTHHINMARRLTTNPFNNQRLWYHCWFMRRATNDLWILRHGPQWIHPT